MRTIELTQGQRAKVDDDIYEYLMQWKWYAIYNHETKSFYAGRRFSKSERANGANDRAFMHRAVLEFYGKIPDVHVHHADHDTLNNQCYNIRFCTVRQNAENRRDNTSGYAGVSRDMTGKKWRAHIRVNGIKRHVGTYNTASEASAARSLYKSIHCIDVEVVR